LKACRACGRLFSDAASFCQADGESLSDIGETILPADATDTLVGQRICDRYWVTRVVADGGMGRVYEGFDQATGRHVALKVLHADVAQDSVSVERFKREYEVSSSLPHEHIVEVSDFQPWRESFVLVMEFLVGEELRSVLKREKTLAPARLLRMVSQIAVGLDEAHRRQFVHRDLKPDNIFLCQTQTGDIVKLLDFGSVKDRKRGAKQLTVLGTTIGSPYYMSPEQAQALDTMDHRADVWALTAVIYECLTGTVPFKGNNGPSILMEILRKDPTPPSAAVTDSRYPVPANVDAVIAKGLQKAAVDRIASIRELADELGRAYGITGSDHRSWAYTSEHELAIALGGPRPDPAQPRPDVDSRREFESKRGEVTAQGVSPGTVQGGTKPREALTKPMRTTNARPHEAALESGPPRVPLHRPPLWIYISVVGLVVGFAAFWFLS
jgi:serine/threonine protein kinase